MFRSIKVSVTLGAAVLIASPGCCLPNLLCGHSSPSEEVVVAGYPSEFVGDDFVVSSDCGCEMDCGCELDCGCEMDLGSDCGCDAGGMDAGYIESGEEIVSGGGELGSFVSEPSNSNDFQPTPAVNSTSEGSGSKVADIVKPPADLKAPSEKSLPGNFLP